MADHSFNALVRRLLDVKRWFFPDGFVGDDYASKRNARWLYSICILLITFSLFIAMLLISFSLLAREGDDHGNHGPLKSWFDKLASKKGLCCSFADGVKVEDVDWDTGGPNGEYRVRLYGEWMVVPDEAVIKEPNRFGPAVVWPYTDTQNTKQIRCFMPGAGA